MGKNNWETLKYKQIIFHLIVSKFEVHFWIVAKKKMPIMHISINWFEVNKLG